MKVVEQVAPLRAAVGSWRARGERVALVPTMGNLHEGHLVLVREAGAIAERVVVSIFVNPLQFGPSEDFGSYPRTLEDDLEKLAGETTHLVFVPSVATMYPGGQGGHTRVEVPQLSDILCGAARPGHFVGVATVVIKLLNLVQADVAVFGEKDFQQLAVIRRMVADLCLPVEVCGVATVRESDGLAMSSRNAYLSAEERRRAPLLHRVLTHLREAACAGAPDYAALEQDAAEKLRRGGFVPDYVSIRRSTDLSRPQASDKDLVVLAAARLGRARLIDNLRISRSSA